MARSRRPSVARYHDRVAGRYDQTYDDAFWQWHDALTWDHLKGFLPAEARAAAIDLGCGTGKWGQRLLDSGFVVTFLDISHQMIDQVSKKLEGLPAASRATYTQGDLSDLSALPQDHFALATAFGEPLCCTPNPAKALRQIRGILRDGGMLVATIDNRYAALDYYLEKGKPDDMEKFLRDGRTNWLTREHAERFELVTLTPTAVRKMVETSGFQLVDMVGKTVLPMRHHRALLAEPEDRRAWMKIEKSLWRDPDAIGRAPHIQFAAKAV
jgi:SAM-dependent methyltransferase